MKIFYYLMPIGKPFTLDKELQDDQFNLNF